MWVIICLFFRGHSVANYTCIVAPGSFWTQTTNTRMVSSATPPHDSLFELANAHGPPTHLRSYTLISGVSSNWNYVHTGVPQGTILGPLLFTIFVNDLPRVVEHCSTNLYADDTTVYCSASDSSIETNLAVIWRVQSG